MERSFNMIPKKLILIIITFAFLISGCAGTMYNFKEEYDRVTNPSTDWNQQAELYAATYPDCTDNQKALMLANDMKREGENVYLNHKIYRIKVIYVYKNGKQVWPIDRKKKYNKLF